MASFEEIMRMPANSFKPPEAFPAGWYHCLVTEAPEHGKSSQKQTDYLRFKFKIMAAMDGTDKEAVAAQQVIGKTITNDYYVTDSASYRLTEMLVNDLGIERPERGFAEMCSEVINKQLLVELKHELSQDGKRVFHRVNSTKAVTPS